MQHVPPEEEKVRRLRLAAAPLHGRDWRKRQEGQACSRLKQGGSAANAASNAMRGEGRKGRNAATPRYHLRRSSPPLRVARSNHYATLWRA